MTDKQRRWLLLSALLAAVITVFAWAYSHGTIEINVQNPSGSLVDYTFTNQQTGKTKTVRTGPHAKIRTGSGEYEVSVRQDNKTGYLLARAGHFLKADSHSTGLSAESGVTFVGDNPAGCMIYTGRLFSFNCGQSLYDSITLHVAATKSTPTYTTKINYGLEPLILGAVNYGDNVLLLARSVDSEGPSGYSLILTDKSLAPIKQVQLSLDRLDSGYSISPYGKGFIVYSNDYRTVEIFSAYGQKPVTVNFEPPRQPGLTALSLSTDGSHISVLSTNGPGAKNPASEVVSYNSGRFSHYSLAESVSKAVFCGSQKLCVLSGGSLKVFALGGTAPSYLYSLSGVKALDFSSATLMVINDTGVIAWDADIRSGHISYSWGGYTYQTIQPAPGGYILSITDKQGNKRAAFIDSSAASDSIDKKILQLQALPQVSGVSIYKNYIFVTPNIGSLVYDSAAGSYMYDPAEKKAANDKITAEIKNLGINTNKYTVINTSE
ncbi:MAG TPA: hypothetical protein VFJ84_03605 [Candidatus Saccharimonadales bacterium]|nr:hypothetical protein [Candidatus Saccharimonadales bacterium]